MENAIQFTRNYSDLSTDRGFQFEFFCDRCGSGFRTRFQASATGRVTDVLQAAGGLLGGVFGSAAGVSERVRSAGWETAHDNAWAGAVDEMGEDFIQCPRCRAWVCRCSCWNEKRGLCKNCSPDLGVEMSAAQSSKSVEEIWAHAKMAEEDKQLTEANWRQTKVASCPKCEKPLASVDAKFCPECGEKLAAKAFCTECGGEVAAGAKFCQGCGKAVEN